MRMLIRGEAVLKVELVFSLLPVEGAECAHPMVGKGAGVELAVCKLQSFAYQQLGSWSERRSSVCLAGPVGAVCGCRACTLMHDCVVLPSGYRQWYIL